MINMDYGGIMLNNGQFGMCVCVCVCVCVWVQVGDVMYCFNVHVDVTVCGALGVVSAVNGQVVEGRRMSNDCALN